jgi:hypothetical protein
MDAMSKLKLELDQISVNAFEVLPAEAQGGKGAEMLAITDYSKCQQDTCWNGSCGTGVPCRQCP